MITTFDYNTTIISFDFNKETTSTMVNATDMLKVYPSKRMASFMKSQTTIAFMNALKADLNDEDIIKVIKGSDPTLQGTWMHEDLALYFAQWLDPVFHIWCNRKIKELLTTGQTTATDEERLTWFQKFPELKKQIKKGKRWKEPVKQVMEKMANDSVRMDDVSLFINDILKGVKKDYKVDACKHLKEATIEAYEARGNDPIIDRLTKEFFLEAISNYVQKLLKRRLTLESTRANKSDEVVETLRTELIDLKKALNGDPRPYKFDLRSDSLATDIDDVLDYLPCSDYKKIFANHLTKFEPTTTSPMNKPHLTGGCSLLLTSQKRTVQGEAHVNAWVYDTTSIVSVVAQLPLPNGKAEGRTICNIKLNLSADNEEMMVGSDQSNQYHATYHVPSKYLIIYKNNL